MKPQLFFALSLFLPSVALYGQTGPQAGVGFFLNTDGPYIVIAGVVPGSPAAAQRSISVGDRLVSVAEAGQAPVLLIGKTINEVTPLIRGPVGTTVSLTVVPAGQGDAAGKTVDFVRGQVKGISDWGDSVKLTREEKAPDIEMIELPSGKPERLRDHAGKVIVLEFWSTGCPPCQPQVATLQTYVEKYPEWQGKVVLITASIDDQWELAAKHLAARGWTRTHNVWVGSDAIKTYYVDAVPAVYVMDPQGTIIAIDCENVPDVVNGLLSREANGR